MRSFSRWLPALATLVLLVVALLAPIRRAGSVPVGDVTFSTSCDLLLEQSLGADSSVDLYGVGGLTQPLHLTTNVAACSLVAHGGYYSVLDVRMLRWNPATLTPDPNSIALRTAYFILSMTSGQVSMVMNPALVLRESPSIAEGLGAGDFALEVTDDSFYRNSVFSHYDPAGPASLPTALQFASNPNTTQTPLPGEHPVLSHRICGGSSALQSLATVQSVTRGDTTLGGAAVYEAVQRFRLPVDAGLRWIEFPEISSVGGVTGTIEIYDATGQASPPATWPASALAHASYFGVQKPAWVSHLDFDTSPSLVAGHDYWFVNRTSGWFTVGARRRDGSESADFQSAIGPFFIRSGAGAAWTNFPKIALDFRVIGQPAAAVSVDPRLPEAGTLRLTVTPSPAHGPVAVSWTGARGEVRFDVIDARGRRVAGGEAAAAANGRWSWNGAGADGRALPAGVYFVRAHDAANTATQRAVLVR